MKRKMLLMLLLATFNNFAKEVDVKIRIGTQASFGIEGLDINVDKENTFKMFLPRENIYGEEKSDNINKFARKIQNLTVEEPKAQATSFSNEGKAKDLMKEIVKRGAIIDVPSVDIEFDIHRIKTKLGAKLRANSLTFRNKKYEPGIQKAFIYSNTDTEHFKMLNKLYIKGYDKKSIGFDKYRELEDISGKDVMEFESAGKVRATKGYIRPELAYVTSLSNKKREIFIAPSLEVDVINNKDRQLTVSANYHFSNQAKDKFNVQEIRKDVEDFAPGNTEVDYFKKWELGKIRDIEKGELNGKKGSIRSINLPTGTLYGKNLMEYSINLAYKSLIQELGEAGTKMEKVLNKIQDNKQNGKLTLDDIKELSVYKDQYSMLSSKFKDNESVIKFISPFVEKALYEFGMKKEEEVSNFHISNYIPDNYMEYLKFLKKEVKNQVAKPQNVTMEQLTKKKKMTIADDIDFIFPEKELEDVGKIIGSTKILKSVDKIGGLIEKFKTPLEKLSEAKNNYDKVKAEYDSKKCSSFWDWGCKIDKGFLFAKLGVEALEVGNKLLDVRKIVDDNKKEILEVLDDGIATLKKFDDNSEKVKNSIKNLEDRKKDIENLVHLAALDWSKIRFTELYSNFNNLKNMDETYIKPINEIVQERGTNIVKKASNIVIHPEKVENFDMFSGIQILKTEHDVKKKEYYEKMKKEVLSKIDKDFSGIVHGMNLNLFYNDNIAEFYTNLNIDINSFKKNINSLNKYSIVADFAYEPSSLDFKAKTALSYKDFKLAELKYGKLNIETNVLAKLKLMSNNKKWLFKPGIQYIGEFEYLNLENSPVEVEIYKRKDNKLVKKANSALTSSEEFNKLEKGAVVDINKYSKYLFKEGFDKYFEMEKSKGQSRWLTPIHTFIPTVEILYSPTKNVEIDYNFILPIRVKKEKIEGVMVKNGLGITLKF